MRCARSVTLTPIGMFWRNLKVAIECLARITTGCCPVIAVRSPTAASIFFASCTASPTPMLTTILSRRGTCIGFW